MKAIVVGFVIAAAAGCGVVTAPGSATGGSDDAGTTMSGSGSDSGSGSGAGSNSGSGSGSGSTIPPNVMLGSIYDERNDTIDFSSGVPVHTHTGAKVDLSNGCPAVYKYAYLMGQHVPVFGHENVMNPLAWQIRSNSLILDRSATAYRVTDANNAVLVDWTSLTADAQGVYHVSLFRDALPQLGTTTGQFHVDVRFRDIGGSDVIDSACFENHPLAAPLMFGPVSPGALFGMTLQANSAISPLLNAGGSGVEIATMPITQQTNEDVSLTLDMSHLGGISAVELIDRQFGTNGVAQTPVRCATTNTDQFCYPQSQLPQWMEVLNDSQPLSGYWKLRIVDDHGSTMCDGWGSATTVTCAIPRRDADAPARTYRAILTLQHETSLLVYAPAWVYGFTEQVFSAASFTGAVNPASVPGCAHTYSVGTGSSEAWWCDQKGDVHEVYVLDKARIEFDAIPFAVTTAIGAAVWTPTYVDLASTTLPAKTWDAGDKGLDE